MSEQRRFPIFEEPSLVLCLFTLTLLLAPDIPQWAFITSMVTWIWKLLGEKFSFPLPSRFLSGFFSVIFLILTFFEFHTFIGREPGTTFLVLLAGLKVLELSKESEKRFLVFLGLILMVAKFLYSIDLIYSALAGPIFLGFMANLMPTTIPKLNLKDRMILILKYIGVALPITILLYLIFPRISQDYFNNNGVGSGKKGQVGFSEELNPGDITELIQSEELVFRVEFQKMQGPQQKDLYWRGAVLSEPIGFHWRKSQGDRQLERQRPNQPEGIEDLNSYLVTIENIEGNHLYTLGGTEYLKSDFIKIFENRSHVYLAQGINEGRVQYTGYFRRNMRYSQKENPNENKHRNLHFSPQVETLRGDLIKEAERLWVKSLPLGRFATRSGLNNKIPTQFLVESIVRYFQEQKFKYSTHLSPQKAELSLDRFLFTDKLGYCEHFASATALLLLAMKVPARIVVGYQGGEYNFIGKFWSVRQRDAHAWVEYKDEEGGWLPFDPVIFIAPLRLELGAALYAQIQDQQLEYEDYLKLKNSKTNQSWLEGLALWYESLNYNWNNQIIGFDKEQQKSLAKALGEKLFPVVIISLILTLGATIIINKILLRENRRRPSRIIFNYMNSYFTKLELTKKDQEGPLQWRERISQNLPKEVEVPLHNLFECYFEVAYQSQEHPRQIKRALSLIQRLHEAYRQTL